MTKHEKLQEQYEDALFALLMEEFAVEEGKSALEENERLKRDPTFDVPPDVRQRCLKQLPKLVQNSPSGGPGNRFARFLQKLLLLLQSVCFYLRQRLLFHQHSEQIHLT